MLRTSFRIAVRALNRNKLRTALTMLGMMIGVAAVIAMVALGTGASGTVSDDLQSAGTTLINVRSGNYTRGGSESNIGTGLGAATTLTPTTRKVRSRMTTSRPTGFTSSPKRRSRAVCPRTATAAPDPTSLREKYLPFANDQPWIFGNEKSVPWICVYVF